MAQIKGTVEDAEGRVVHKALATVEESPLPFPDMALLTNSDGRFIIELPEGRFRLTAHSEDGKYGTVEYDSSTNNPLIIRLSQ